MPEDVFQEVAEDTLRFVLDEYANREIDVERFEVQRLSTGLYRVVVVPVGSNDPQTFISEQGRLS